MIKLKMSNRNGISRGVLNFCIVMIIFGEIKLDFILFFIHVKYCISHKKFLGCIR